MAKPDFSLVWAIDRPGGIAAISSADYSLGWQFRAGVPPLTVNFDYYQNLNDQRTIWLSEQFPVDGTSAYVRTILNAADAPAFRSTTGTNNASNLNTGTLSPNRLADSGAIAGNYGGTTTVPVVSVDAKGRVTAINVVSIAFPVPPSAGEGQAGTIFEATQTEVDSRTGAGKSMSPAKFGSGFSINISGNGHIALPNILGGWVLNWGNLTLGGGAFSTPAMSRPFSTVCLHAWTQIYSTSTDGSGCMFASPSGTNCRFTNPEGSTRAFGWFTIGK